MKTIEIPIDDNFKSVYHYEDDGTLIDHSMESTKKSPSTANTDSCVSRKLKIIAKENPDMAIDQQLAIAYSYCEKEGIAELAADLKAGNDVNIIS